MSLWRNREFTLLWTSQTLSDLGHAMTLPALPLLVLALTGDPVLAGLTGTVIAVTRLLVRLPAGVLADRIDRRRALIVCDVVRVIALAGLAVALFGYQAATTPDHLQGRVISVIYLIATSASAAAPMVTGLLVAASGATLALLVWSAVMAAGAVASVVARGLKDTEVSAPVLTQVSAGE